MYLQCASPQRTSRIPAELKLPYHHLIYTCVRQAESECVDPTFFLNCLPPPSFLLIFLHHPIPLLLLHKNKQFNNSTRFSIKQY